MNEGNPFVYMIQSIFKETTIDSNVDPTPKRIQHLMDFFKYVVENNLQRTVVLSLGGYARSHSEFAMLLNQIFILFRQGFGHDNPFKIIRNFVQYMDVSLLKEFMKSLSREEMFQLLGYTLNEDILKWYTYIFENYINPSDIPKVRRGNGELDYPEYLQDIASLVLFRDPEFITHDRILVNNAFLELLRTTHITGSPYDNYMEQIEDVNIDVLLNRSFDGLSFDDVMQSQKIVLHQGVYMPETDFEERNPVFNTQNDTEKHNIARALNFINKFLGDELREGISREPGIIQMNKLIQSNRVRLMERDTSNAIVSAAILKLESIVQELIPYFNEYDSKLARAFADDLKGAMDNYEAYLNEVGEETGLRISASYQLIDFYYSLIRDWIGQVKNEGIQNELQKLLSEHTIKSLPETVMESFIGEDVLLREKRLTQPFPEFKPVDFYQIRKFLNSKLEIYYDYRVRIKQLKNKIREYEYLIYQEENYPAGDEDSYDSGTEGYYQEEIEKMTKEINVLEKFMGNNYRYDITTPTSNDGSPTHSSRRGTPQNNDSESSSSSSEYDSPHQFKSIIQRRFALDHDDSEDKPTSPSSLTSSEEIDDEETPEYLKQLKALNRRQNNLLALLRTFKYNEDEENILRVEQEIEVLQEQIDQFRRDNMISRELLDLQLEIEYLEFQLDNLDDEDIEMRYEITEQIRTKNNQITELRNQGWR